VPGRQINAEVSDAGRVEHGGSAGEPREQKEGEEKEGDTLETVRIAEFCTIILQAMATDALLHDHPA
jgi:hypothetical protein